MGKQYEPWSKLHMKAFFIRLLLPITLCVVLITAVIASLPIISYYYCMHNISIIEFSKNSYGLIWVYEDKTFRCMSFLHPAQRRNKQTCMFLANNTIPYFKYTQMVLGSLYVQPHPKAVLMIGLGGGGLVRALNSLKLDARIDIVEINPEVVVLAKKYFPFEKNHSTKIYIEDGFHYVQNALKNKVHYDLIIMDAFADDYIPKEFLTSSFIKMLKGILSTNGVVAFNTFSNSQYYSLESSLFMEVFGEFYNLVDANRIIIAKNSRLPELKAIEIEASKSELEFSKLEINTSWLLSKFEYVH